MSASMWTSGRVFQALHSAATGSPNVSVVGTDDVILVEELSDRELQVLHMVAGGARNHEIAGELCITVKTVEFHVSNILGKLGARSRTEAVMRAARTGLLGGAAVAS
jgi:DNA-binding NarL/FixJ family response regulator